MFQQISTKIKNFQNYKFSNRFFFIPSGHNLVPKQTRQDETRYGRTEKRCRERKTVNCPQEFSRKRKRHEYS